MASVKLYKSEELKNVQGLYAQRALTKMDGNLEVYSTLLDKYLNEVPRTIPRLRGFIRDKKTQELSQELKDLRIDLADIFALDMLERANLMFDAAEKGDLDKCAVMQDPFISALQSLSYEIKQCRTQELLENADDAALKAAEMDIGATMVNNKYATIPKAKFIELYKRIDGGLLDKAMNLAKVLKAMGYDSEISGLIEQVILHLNNFKQRTALDCAARLIKLLGATPPESSASKFTILVVDSGSLDGTVRQALGDTAAVARTISTEDTLRFVKSDTPPDFILVNQKLTGHDGIMVLDYLKRNKVVDTPLGIILFQPTSQDILNARKLGVVEFFIQPLDVNSFANKIKKYIELKEQARSEN